MKKLLVTVLAVIMTLGMAVTTVNAETTGTTHKYDAYQVFAGTVKDGKISGITTGSGIKFDDFVAALKADSTFGKNDKNAFYGLTTASQIAKAIGNLDTDAKKNRVALIAGKNVKGSGVEVTAGTQKDVGDAGYYVLIDKTASVANDSPILFLTDGDGNITAATKVDVPTVEKTVKDGDNYVPKTVAKVGDTLTFKLEAKLPNNYNDYSAYKLVFKDTLPTGFTFSKITSALVDSEELSSTYYALDKTKNPFTITIADLKKAKSQGAKTVTFEYEATFSGSTNTGTSGYENSAEVTYSNNPTVEGEGTTVPSTAIVYTLKYTVTKVDQDNNALEGAGFTLYKKNAEGTYDAIGSEVKPATGNTFTWSGLDEGNYKLSETTTPSDYVTMEDLTFTVNAAFDTGALVVTASDQSVTSAVAVGDDMNLSSTVKNSSESTLPTTGGMGTMIFYALGAMLICGGAAMIMMRKRAK